jgi:hypothetical protein
VSFAVGVALSSNANLATLSVSPGWLDQTFNYNTTGYTVTVPNATTSITVSATVADTGKAAYQQSPANPVSLSAGSNIITITVTAENGTTRTYSIIVTRTPLSANANLGSLSVSTGTLSPAFSANIPAYTVLVPNVTSSITVTASPADSNASLSLVSPYTATLSGNTTSIPITVTAEDGSTTRIYTVTVNKTTATNAVNVVISIADERIDLTRSTENDLSRQAGNTLRLTAPEGYTNYTWYVDGNSGNYSLISNRVIDLNPNWYNLGTHSVLLEFEKNGIPYGCEVLFRVVR